MESLMESIVESIIKSFMKSITERMFPESRSILPDINTNTTSEPTQKLDIEKTVCSMVDDEELDVKTTNGDFPVGDGVTLFYSANPEPGLG